VHVNSYALFFLGFLTLRELVSVKSNDFPGAGTGSRALLETPDLFGIHRSSEDVFGRRLARETANLTVKMRRRRLPLHDDQKIPRGIFDQPHVLERVAVDEKQISESTLAYRAELPAYRLRGRDSARSAALSAVAIFSNSRACTSVPSWLNGIPGWSPRPH
jgi:hypothetical protein